MLVDTHTHLESFVRRGELEPALERAQAAGVGAMITIGTATDDWPVYRELASGHPGFVFYTAGLHPCSVDERWEEQVAALPTFWDVTPGSSPLPKPLHLPVALGECGLDRFHLPKDDTVRGDRIFAWQRAALAAQLDLAKTLRCPVVVHSRGAFAECVEMIDASGVDWSRVVFHCFTEGEAEMRQLVERGGYASFTGILTYKNADSVRAAARLQGLERFMMETDAPYLTPMPHRGKPNEPSFVRHIAEFAAELFGVTQDELATTSTATAKRFFRLE
jgi:TatD DNase family protein